MKINQNYLDLKNSYLFSTVAKKISAYKEANPDKKVIRMDIGDVTLPLCGAVVTALRKAVEDMSQKETFRGYGPEQGYDFLREAIAGYYAKIGVALSADEIFVSDGAKSDIGNMLDLFDRDNNVLIPDPVYPVYRDTNIMAGRRISFIEANAGNNFLPMPDQAGSADIIYLCSPNNPTGAVYSHEQLKSWVDYANGRGAVIFFDAAYESFVGEAALPRSIFEIPGAETCAVEFCSFSKTAGFTGTRCGYTVVPHALVCGETKLRDMWLRRQTTKFNGVPYIVQRAAEAVFTPEGLFETRKNIAYYMENGKLIAKTMRELGITFVGGETSPYIWMQCGMDSWDYFDMLLERANVTGTPGAGFGRAGEGYFRLTAFGTQEATAEAMERMKALKKIDPAF
ncbi:MAG: LL-diaminopimelate aminotransferase [Oscillospiraceae bacterium]|jgi:LL-diaminopimelate aminotransferase|nr:LL-diaminopimelate aminotransferase [Oscillospiraceae bacterium]